MTRTPSGDGGRSRIVLVRHGETEWSATGRHTGLTDVPLTDRGRHAAALLGPRLPATRWALVLTSPLARAAETCRLAGLGERAVVEPNLLEWDYGEYEGRTTPEIHTERPEWWLWRDGCPGGEDLAQVGARAERVIQRCQTAGGDAIVFSHGHLLRVLGACWVGAEPALGASLFLSTAGFSILGWERQTPVLTSWNSL